MTERTCIVCGDALPAGCRKDRKFCGKRCANAGQLPCTIDGCDKPRRAHGLCIAHYHKDYRVTVSVPCVVCGTQVQRRQDLNRDRPCCSSNCRAYVQWGSVILFDGPAYDWTSAAMARARSFGALVVEPVDRLAVMERDGWRCYLCGIATRISSGRFDATSATVDHVVPLSKGGEHTMANVRCACFGCNAGKQDRLLPATESDGWGITHHAA